MTTPVEDYCVVYHHQYHPEGYRVYDYNDKYLDENPSQYTLVKCGLTKHEADELCSECNERGYLEYMSQIEYWEQRERRDSDEDDDYLSDWEMWKYTMSKM